MIVKVTLPFMPADAFLPLMSGCLTPTAVNLTWSGGDEEEDGNLPPRPSGLVLRCCLIA